MYCSNIEQLVSGEINHESIMKSIKFVLLITDFKQPYLEEKLYVLCLFGCMKKIIICTSCSETIFLWMLPMMFTKQILQIIQCELCDYIQK